MKKRIWVNSPMLYVLLLLIIGFAVQNYVVNGTSRLDILIFQIACVVLAVAAVIVGTIYFHKYLRAAVTAALKTLTPAQREMMEGFPLPMAIVGPSNDLLWNNALFAQKVALSSRTIGENAAKYLSGAQADELEEKGVDVAVGDHLYTVFMNRVLANNDYVTILYYVDNTYYKKVTEEYAQTRPAVAIALFDNLDEIAQSAKAGETAQISAEVEMKLENWVAEAGGFISRIGSGRYLIMTEERTLVKLVEQKFPILDVIRGIHLANRINATISIGIGRGGKSVRECYDMAVQALDMALGRGGDQVVIKRGGEYAFFGGVSKGVEKRSRVRARVVANALSTLFQNCETVFIMGHHNSDLDCIGAALGMWCIVNKGFHKRAYVVADRTTTLAGPVIQEFDDAGLSDRVIQPEQALALANEKSLLVVVDTHSRDFLESRPLYDACRQIVVIDHHRKMVNYIDRAVVFYHEPFASSASEMVTELIEYLAEGKLEQREADALLAGIMLDTKNFVLKTGVRTFEAAAYLRKKGADTIEVKRLFSNSFDSYKAKYQLISEAEIYNNMAIAVSEETGGDLRVVAAQAADELLGIVGVDASFVLFPYGDGVSVSARSLGKVNVQVIMEKVGGGGHLTMAGAQFAHCTMQEGRDRVMAAISDFIAAEQSRSAAAALMEKRETP